jgi:hypothetical protein
MNAPLEILEVQAEEIHLRIDGRIHVVPYVIQGTTVSFVFEGETYAIDVNEKAARAKGRHRDHSAAAPMPGVVLKILVKVGDRDPRGDEDGARYRRSFRGHGYCHQLPRGRDGAARLRSCNPERRTQNAERRMKKGRTTCHF